LTRLGKLTDADFEGKRLMRLGDVTEEYMILHANSTTLRQLSQKASTHKLKASKLKPSTFTILDDAYNVIAAENAGYLSKYKGVAVSGSMDSADVKKLQNKHLTIGRLHKLDSEVIVIPKTSNLAKKLANMDANVGASVEAQVQALRALRKTLPPVVILFEIWNLHSVTHAVKKNAAQTVDIVNAYADLAYATLEGIVQISGEGSVVGKRITEAAIKTGRGRFLVLPALGAGAAFFSFGLALRDMVDNFAENDDDAAIGHAIAAIGFAFVGLAFLGKAGVGALVCLGPYVWAGVAVVLIGVAIAGLFDDSPLETWAANGPFCKGKGAAKFSYLRDKTFDYIAHNKLASILYSPRIEIREVTVPPFTESKKGDILVRVHLINFKVDDEIEVRTCVRRATETRYTMAEQVARWSSQTPMTPYAIRQCTTNGLITAMEYYYRDSVAPSVKTNAPLRLQLWQTKARLLVADGPVLPDPEREEKTGEVIDPQHKIPVEPARKNGESEQEFNARQKLYQKQLDDIDEDVPGWIYAKL
jgi:hypothetical protein